MSVKSKINDLVAELDGEYPSFYVKSGYLYDTEDNELEGIVKVKICHKTSLPQLTVFVNKMSKKYSSGPIDVENLDDPSERLKIMNVLDEVRVALLT